MKLRERIQLFNVFAKHKKDPVSIKLRMEAKLQTGETIYFDIMEENAPVFLVDPTSGQYVPMTEGDYVLEDGSTFSVAMEDVDGVPTSVMKNVKAAEAPAEETPGTPEQPALSQEQQDQAAKSVIESIIKETRYSVDSTLSVQDQIQAVIEHINITKKEKEDKEKEALEFKKQVEERDKALEDATKLLEELDKEAAAEVTHKVSKFRKHVLPNTESRATTLAKKLKELKK